MYDIEFRLAPKQGFSTPSESRRYYGTYDRLGIGWHWWDLPSRVQDSDHDSIVNYILSKATNGTGSINYVVSNTKITLMVSPDNVSWHIARRTAPFPNATEIGVELSPHLNAEGYKKAGWLKWQLELRYAKQLRDTGHNYWVSTQCPGNVSISRIVSERNKWKTGHYNSKPKPTPPPAPTPVPQPEPTPPAPIIDSWILWKEGEVEYETNKLVTYTYDLTSATTWPGIPKVDEYAPKEKIVIAGSFRNARIDRTYYVTRENFENKKAVGFSPADLDIYVPVRPTPVPPTEPDEEPTKPPVIPQPEPPKENPIKKIWLSFILKLVSIFNRKK